MLNAKFRPGSGFAAGNHLIYTVIIGDYDRLKRPRWRPKNVHYVAFTTRYRRRVVRGWTIVRIPDIATEPTMANRQLKICGVQADSYRSVTYLDGSIQVVGSLESFISDLLESNRALAVFLHPDRHSPWQELATCRERGLLSQKQFRFEEIRLSNFREHKNLLLYDAGVLIKNPANPKLKEISSRWFDLFKENPIRDQLSLPIVVFENSLEIQERVHWSESARQVLIRHPHLQNSRVLRILFFMGALCPNIFQSLRRIWSSLKRGWRRA